MTTEEMATSQDQIPPEDDDNVSQNRAPVPVRQRIRSRVPVWILPTMATFSFCIITAVVLSSVVLGFQLHSDDRTLSRNKNHVEAVCRDTREMNASMKSIKTQLSSAVKSQARQAEAQAEFLELLASVQCAVDRHLQNSTEVDGCCPLGWETFHGSCYFISHEFLSWNDSRDWCQAQQSQLFILSTDHDWELMNRYGPFFWVGLTDTSGTWLWVDGSPYTMEPSRWHTGQPDNWWGTEDCAHLHSGRLNDLNCSDRLQFICKKTI